MTPIVRPTVDADSKPIHQIEDGRDCPAGGRHGAISWGRSRRADKKFHAAIYQFERVSKMALSCQVCRTEAKAAIADLEKEVF